MNKMVIITVLLLSLNVGISRALVVADFDSGTKPNNVGGEFGAWDKDPSDMTQYAREFFSKDNRQAGEGYSMTIEYDVDSPNAAFNGFWLQFNNIDASAFTKVVFWAKADAVKGCTPRFKIELKTEGERGAFYVDGLTSEWTKFEIPLESFNISDLSALSEFVVVFEDHTSLPKTGILYLDDISLE
ncbi:MAG: carbohydrate binding domain-containing protein [Lentisphaerota bacterium]